MHRVRARDGTTGGTEQHHPGALRRRFIRTGSVARNTRTNPRSTRVPAAQGRLVAGTDNGCIAARRGPAHSSWTRGTAFLDPRFEIKLDRERLERGARVFDGNRYRKRGV